VSTTVHRSATETPEERRRRRIRTTVRAAAAPLAPTWPLERFVATNPLVGLEQQPWAEAVLAAPELLGARAEVAETEHRRALAEGRLRAADLDAALRARRPDLTGSALDAARRELLVAPPIELGAVPPVLAVELLDAAVGSGASAWVDDRSAWWAAAYLGDHPAWPMPGREAGLWSAFRRHAVRDRRLAAWGPVDPAELVAQLPDRPDDAVARLLVELGVDRPDHERYLRRHLARSAGWTAAVVRRVGVDGDDLVAWLALRLVHESVVLADAARRRVAAGEAARRSAGDAEIDADGVAPGSLLAAADRVAIWRDAAERPIRDGLLAALAAPSSGAGTRPATHAVFCIDPRSEGLRRHLERRGDHRTVGFAGFFGLPIGVAPLGHHDAVPSCPVILAPQAAVAEEVLDDHRDRWTVGTDAWEGGHDVFVATKRAAVAPFALAETMGWAAGFRMAARTLAPRRWGRLVDAAHRATVGAAPTRVTPIAGSWWDLDQQVAVASGILRTTGLDRGPARLVLLCGHGSHHVNNLHRAALDCGACGGRSGSANARAAVALLNDPDVRRGLAASGIEVPDDTWFVAGEHDTATDRVELFDLDLVPADHLDDLARLAEDLEAAGRDLAAERAPSLPVGVGRSGAAAGRSVDQVRARAADWAQVVPEWGLVGCTALVVGPRSMTAGVDLGRRVFLHSYEPDHDPDGSVLAGILGGPLVVAHWITSQYRASVIDPDRFGAGSKALHNLIGGVGAIEGSGGDVRLGLPAESVADADGPRHDPVRLLVVLDAPARRVDELLAADPAVGHLVTGGWIRVVARPPDRPWSPERCDWAERRPEGGWSGVLVDVRGAELTEVGS